MTKLRLGHAAPITETYIPMLGAAAIWKSIILDLPAALIHVDAGWASSPPGTITTAHIVLAGLCEPEHYESRIFPLSGLSQRGPMGPWQSGNKSVSDNTFPILRL